MLETENLNLPLYELNDAANLADGYNSAMQKLDAAYKSNEDRFPITSADIEDGGVNTVDLANGAVTTNKLATAAVTGDKIAEGCVTSTAIAEGAVTSAALAEGAVTSAALSTEVKNLIDPKPIMLCFGDSYGVDSISEGPVWCEVAAKKLQVSDMRNYCVGGATFNTTKDNNFDVQVNRAITEIQDKQNVKYVGIVGGTNDSSNSIVNAIVALVSKIHTNFPNAVIGIGLNASKQDILSVGAKNKRIAALNLNGLINMPVFIDSLVYLELGTGCMMADNTHPTAKGSNYFGTSMAGILQGCIGGVVTSNAAVNTQLISSADLRTLSVVMYGRRITYTGSINATSGQILDLTTIYPDSIKGSVHINDSNVNIVGYITTGAANYPSVRVNSSFNGVAYFGFDSYVV